MRKSIYDLLLWGGALAGGGGSGGGTGGDTPSGGEEWIGDGNTHIWITLPEGRKSPMLGVGVNGTVTVDWGDGTTPDVLTGTDTNTVKWTPTHNYASAGDYVITLTVDGEMGIVGDSFYGASILRYSSTGDSQSYVYRNAVKKVELANSVTSIGQSAFSGCYSLASITIPDGVTSIGNSAFSSCYRLASITIPDGVTSIGQSAFYLCYSLTSISIPDSVTSIGNEAFRNCYNLASITIPDSVTSIGDTAFGSCYSLTSISIPDSVTSIGKSAVSYCYSLASITIPDGVTSIGQSAVSNGHSLASITIPDSVTSIGNSAFSNCYCLGKIRFERTTPPTVSNSNAFSNVPTDCVISVPVGSLEAYKTATNYPSASTYTYVEE